MLHKISQNLSTQAECSIKSVEILIIYAKSCNQLVTKVKMYAEFCIKLVLILRIFNEFCVKYSCLILIKISKKLHLQWTLHKSNQKYVELSKKLRFTHLRWILRKISKNVKEMYQLCQNGFKKY